MKKKIIIAALALVSILGVSLYALNSQQPIKIEGYSVDTGTYEEEISAIGYVEYETEMTLQSDIPGSIRQVYVKEGDQVDGQTLVIELDDTDARKRYASLEANLRLAKARYADYLTNYNVALSNANKQRETQEKQVESLELSLKQVQKELEKTQALQAEGIVPLANVEALQDQVASIQSNIDVAKAALNAVVNPTYSVEELEAAIALAELNLAQQEDVLSDFTIHMPFDALVLERFVNPGDYVQPASQLLQIGSVNDKVIWVDIDERYLSDISLGQVAWLTPESYPETRYEGQIVGFSPSVNRETGTIGVKIAVEKDNDKLIRNMSVKVDVTTVEYADVLLIPGNYLVDKEGLKVLMAKEGGLVEAFPVTIQNQNKDMVYVLEGLSKGDVVLDPAKVSIGDVVEGVGE